MLSLGKLLSSKRKESAISECFVPECAITVNPPDDLHNMNTNDLETLIETKQQEMKQLRAEETVLLERQKTFSMLNGDYVPIKENDITDFSEDRPVEKINLR